MLVFVWKCTLQRLVSCALLLSYRSAEKNYGVRMKKLPHMKLVLSIADLALMPRYCLITMPRNQLIHDPVISIITR